MSTGQLAPESLQGCMHMRNSGLYLVQIKCGYSDLPVFDMLMWKDVSVEEQTTNWATDTGARVLEP